MSDNIYTLWFIRARTGCTCCSNENHIRGPYSSAEDAHRRVQFYRKSEGPDAYWPLASQHVHRGAYSVFSVSAETISEDRVILNYDRVVSKIGARPIVVNEDGSVPSDDQDREFFYSDEYEMYGTPA